MDTEFTDEDGNGTGLRIYLQLKSGNVHLRLRKSDGAETKWVGYRLRQPGPVFLVIGTFPEKNDCRKGRAAFLRACRRFMPAGSGCGSPKPPKFLSQQIQGGTQIDQKNRICGLSESAGDLSEGGFALPCV